MLERSGSLQGTGQRQRKGLAADEQGFATLVVAITLVIVLSLLTVGFAQLMRNEQNQATNRQLSNQAYYAAESGINDAIRALADGFQGSKTTCGPIWPPNSAGDKDLADSNVDTTPVSGPPSSSNNGATQWTCLLINRFPSTLEYGSVDTITPTVFTASGVQSDGTTPVNINTITISWRDADSSVSTFRTNSGVAQNAFPTAGNWNATGALRVAITPLTDLSRSALTNNTFTTYLYPSTATDNTSTTYTNDPANQGQILNGGCSPSSNTQFYCSVSIDVSALGTSNFAFNLRSIYSKTHVQISSDSGTYLQGAQVVIDSTGRAQDVLKRLQVRVPDVSHYYYPGFSVESIGGICKQLQVRPGFASGCGY